MLEIINSNIHINRGDKGRVQLKIPLGNNLFYQFRKGDKLVLKVKEKYSDKIPKLEKTLTVQEDSDTVVFDFNEEDTKKMCDLIDEPQNFVYDVALNENQTIIGYDLYGKKEFIVYPEGGEENE